MIDTCVSTLEENFSNKTLSGIVNQVIDKTTDSI